MNVTLQGFIGGFFATLTILEIERAANRQVGSGFVVEKSVAWTGIA